MLGAILFSFALEYASKGVYENQEKMNLNGKHQFPVYAEDVTLLVESINIIMRNIDALLDAVKGVGIGVNSQKTRYMLMSHG
jgi:hypothetical protein